MTKNIVTEILKFLPTTTQPKVASNVRGTNGDTTSRISLDGYQKSTDSAQYGDLIRLNNGSGRAKTGINYTSIGMPAILYSTLAGTYNIQTTDTLILKVDGVQTTITFSGVTAGAATTDEVCNRINTVMGFPLQAIKTPGGDSDFFRLVTQSLGETSSIEVVGGTARAALGLAIGTTLGEPIASPARFIPGTTDGEDRYSPFSVTGTFPALANGMVLTVTVSNVDSRGNTIRNVTNVTFSTSTPPTITAGAATWQEVVAAINAVAVGFYAFGDFDTRDGVRVGLQTTTYGEGVTLTIGSGTANAALGYVATVREGGDGTQGDGRQLAWVVPHFLPNNETTSVEHWHISYETADSEGKARTRFEIKWLADVVRVIFSSCYVILNDVNMYVSSLAGNRDIWFMSDKEPQNKYRLCGIRSRATAGTGNGRAAGSAGDLTFMTTDSTGSPADIAICHRGTNTAMSMRGAIMMRQRTTNVTTASATIIGPENGNVFFLAVGSPTNLNTLNRTGWQAGAEITLHFSDTNTTLVHSTAASTATVASLRLSGAVNYAGTLTGSIKLQIIFDPTLNDNTTGWYWKEVGRST
jgi:hypothetical protein